MDNFPVGTFPVRTLQQMLSAYLIYKGDGRGVGSRWKGR